VYMYNYVISILCSIVMPMFALFDRLRVEGEGKKRK
jgi:hypothetical protein